MKGQLQLTEQQIPRTGASRQKMMPPALGGILYLYRSIVPVPRLLFILVNYGLVHQRSQFPVVIYSSRRDQLREVHHYQVLFRIHPVRRVIRTSPAELAF